MCARRSPKGRGATEAGFPGSPGLLKKYRALALRYQALVQKYETSTHKRMDIALLAHWAMRTSHSGLCLIREGNLVLKNPRFAELEGASGSRRWRKPAWPRSPASSLRRLIAADAEELLASQAQVAHDTYRQSGRELWLEVRLERVPGAEPPLVMCLVHDMTAQMKGGRELERARVVMRRRERLRDLGEMAAGIAHDLNNTFNALGLRLEFMARRATEEKAIAELEAVRRIVADATARVARLQAFAGRGEEKAEEDVDLGAIIGDAIEMVRPQLDKNGAHPIRIVTKKPTAPLPPVRAVPAELRHLFANLFINARDAMQGRGGQVTVELRRRAGGGVICTVSDQGTGIPIRILKRVFDPFFTTKGAKGSGLGLSVAQQTMSRLGGTVAAANRPRGGAVFTLTFPPRPAPKAAAAAAPLGIAPPREARSGRILVVDDDADNLDVMRQLLEMEGHQVVLAPSGDDGLAALRVPPSFDIILCDLDMPGKNGWEVARAMKSVAPGTPIVILTGWASAERSPTAGEVGVMHKPVQMDMLRALLAKAMAISAAGGR